MKMNSSILDEAQKDKFYNKLLLTIVETLKEYGSDENNERISIMLIAFLVSYRFIMIKQADNEAYIRSQEAAMDLAIDISDDLMKDYDGFLEKVENEKTTA